MLRILTASLFTLLISVATIGYSQTVIEDFENGLTGAGTNNWDDDGLAQYSVTADPLNSNNSVLVATVDNILTSRDTAYMNYEFTFGPTGDNFARIGFDFYADEGARSDDFDIEVGIGSYVDATPDDDSDFAALIGIRFDITDGYHLVVEQPGFTSGNRRVIDFNWIPERWYSVAFELDTSTNTFEIFVENEKMYYDSDGNGSLDSSTFDFLNYSLDLFSFGIIASRSVPHSVDTDEFLYIDNITFSDVPFTETPVLLGDVNLDGAVTFLDIAPFIAHLSAGTYQVEADIIQTGEVTFLDIFPFIEILAGNVQ